MKYYVYNSQRNSMFTCESLDHLIRYFASANHNVFYSKMKGNSLFEDVAMNWNDVKVGYVRTYDSDSGYVRREIDFSQRTIMVFDEYDRTIDPRQFKDQILNYKFKYTSYRKFPKSEFRKEPVPGIRKRRYHRGSHYRLIRTFQERKLSCDPEIKEYVNLSRTIWNLPNSWDDIPRERDHCWKAKKLKKQWMKHLK